MTHVLVIGAYGSAGATVARALADDPDVDLTLVDDGDPGGGLCILRGCMPSKELLSAGAHRVQARHDDRLVGDPPAVDLDSTVERKNTHTENWAAHRRAGIEDLADREDVTLRRETARFVGPRGVAVGEETLDPDYVVVATGSSPSIPALEGIDEVDYWTSADVLDARTMPDSAVVMGFGYIGMELVPYLAENGVDCTVIEHDDRPLDEADPAFGDALLDLYREQFDLTVPTNCHEQRVEPTEDGVALHVEYDDGEYDTFEGEKLVCFTGREPTLEPLDLDAAGIDPGPGFVADTMQAVDDERVFVVGDANGREPILHVAKEQGQVAAENVRRHAAGDPLEAYENTHHHVVFSGLGVYPYARVGHSETSAREAGLDPIVVTREARDDGVFKTKDVPEGLARLVVDPDDGTVLGWQGLHYHADVMAKTMQVVVELGLDVREVPDRSYHPTTPEILDGLLRAASARLDG